MNDILDEDSLTLLRDEYASVTKAEYRLAMLEGCSVPAAQSQNLTNRCSQKFSNRELSVG